MRVKVWRHAGESTARAAAAQCQLLAESACATPGLYTTDFDELLKHWATLTDRFGNSDGGFATTLLGVSRLPAPQLLVMLEATAVD